MRKINIKIYGYSLSQNSVIKYFMIGLALCYGSYFFGPYKYNISNYNGVIYTLVMYILFAIGAVIGDIHNRKKTLNAYVNNGMKMNEVQDINPKEENLLMAMEIIAIFCAMLYIWEMRNSLGEGMLFSLEDIRREASTDNTVASQIGELGSYLGPVVYLAALNRKNYIRKIIFRISKIVLWLPGICTLAMGARWGIIVDFLIFLMTREKRIKKGSNFKKIIVGFWCFMILWVIYNLFKNRGYYSANEVYLFNYGDMELRAWAESLYYISNGAIDPIYKMSMYLSHPVAAFPYIFSNNMPEHMYWGAYILRVPGFIFNFFSIPFPKTTDIANSTFTGLYSGTVYGYLVDWGIFLTPIMIFLTGILFSRITKIYTLTGRFKNMQVLVKIMSMFVPFYFIWHAGGIDFIIFFLGIYNIIIKIFGIQRTN